MVILMDSNVDLNDLIEYSKGGVLSKELFDDSGYKITLFCMGGGTNISEHTSTREGLVHVLEGDGIFNLEGADIHMKAGVLIDMKANAIHSLKANGDTSFLLILK